MIESGATLTKTRSEERGRVINSGNQLLPKHRPLNRLSCGLRDRNFLSFHSRLTRR